MSFSGTRSPRSPHAAAHNKKPSLSSFTGLTGRPSISSFSTPMHWLSRNSSSASESKAHHKASRSIELLSPRSGALGSGATVVRTPDDALKDSGVRLPPHPEEQPGSPASLAGRTLPPLPSELESDDDGERVGEYHTYPKRAPPPCPIDTRPPFRTSSPVEVPSPPFRVLLVSEPPNSTVDRSKVLVTLETCTTTFRTTLHTLLAQPSYLSEYLLSLFPPPRNMSCSSSIYSTGSEGEHDMQETYRNHLISQGLLSKSPFNLHLFLDRPSESYPLILSYLRSGTFPRLFTLEALLDLRDEAAFLGLSALHELCAEEVRQQTGVNEGRAPSVRSMHASVHSLHALIERVGRESHADYRDDPDRDRSSHPKGSSSESGGFKPPTPQSWKNGRSSSTSHGHGRSMSSAGPQGRSTVSLRSPAGWI
ncbi:hypothetical protein BDZ89DRAFT_1055978 [Hymenopellis radicata]|nr:hypothetical protein BDZ89DRAFT_1055978 [Hymenopellis radicata]